ncbi:hypothetical protein V6N13_037688 [Hibiscus sabdariffa]
MTFFLSISLSAILLILIRLLLLATIWSDSRRAGLRFHVVVQSKFSALSFLAINFGFETSEGFVFGSSFFQVPFASLVADPGRRKVLFVTGFRRTAPPSWCLATRICNMVLLVAVDILHCTSVGSSLGFFIYSSLSGATIGDSAPRERRLDSAITPYGSRCRLLQRFWFYGLHCNSCFCL